MHSIYYILKWNYNNLYIIINIKENKDKKIFAHCNAGISRSPSIIIAYLIKELKYSFKDAFNLVKSKRNIKPNEKFIQELQNLQNNN